MENIQLKERTIEPHHGRNVDKAPALLTRWDKGEGFIPSEADMRLLGVRNFENAPELANNYWDTSTLVATKGETMNPMVRINEISITPKEILAYRDIITFPGI